MMTADDSRLHDLSLTLSAGQPLPATAEAWLAGLPGPVMLRYPGVDRTRVRALVTLLHGNEPSGLRAIHGWLSGAAAAPPPATDLVLIIANVAAARLPPRYNHRQLPNERDLNRCFRAPWQDGPGQLAQAILSALVALGPEAVLDLHNTSGASPPFAVAAIDDARHRAFAARFCDHLIVTDLRLGALMEAAEHLFPTLTIECGGSGDPRADAMAATVISRFADSPALFAAQPATDTLTVFRNPVRVELAPGASLSFDPSEVADVMLRTDIQQHNFGLALPGVALASLGRDGLGHLVARDHRGRPVLTELFEARAGTLTPRQPLHLFMATARADIAASDCLFYVAPAQQQH
ncbi:succinylglutamate desuccinylase/aspartoacylase family protein [Alcanivorax sp. JB21]|uniref:succinylglutamate desuccinylase/aspartoacylase domain-containing protein n=1 Tax=Alcanivorax limicola TaxID=2874102 RepID=UPI001CBF58F4|nr:succinylglutamate desuccinylase/aspartoacylase family protein [Alcanivorax limicola]MBZ2188311.1 succinylglutamate desuccinylase/aspartoacylase family protein [Alcanivorax limicola]